MADCNRDNYSRGYCQAHYERWLAGKRGAELETPIRRSSAIRGDSCRVEGCPRSSLGSGYCLMHQQRVRRNGHPGRVGPYRDSNKKFIDILDEWCTFVGAHQRVARLWGAASQYPCIECGRQAQDWAYDGTDPTEIYGFSREGELIPGSSSGCFYSRFPEFYMPMCKKCHKRRDMGVASRQLREYRILLHYYGASFETLVEHLTAIGDAQSREE